MIDYKKLADESRTLGEMNMDRGGPYLLRAQELLAEDADAIDSLIAERDELTKDLFRLSESQERERNSWRQCTNTLQQVILELREDMQSFESCATDLVRLQADNAQLEREITALKSQLPKGNETIVDCNCAECRAALAQSKEDR